MRDGGGPVATMAQAAILVGRWGGEGEEVGNARKFEK